MSKNSSDKLDKVINVKVSVQTWREFARYISNRKFDGENISMSSLLRNKIINILEEEKKDGK